MLFGIGKMLWSRGYAVCMDSAWQSTCQGGVVPSLKLLQRCPCRGTLGNLLGATRDAFALVQRLV